MIRIRKTQFLFSVISTLWLLTGYLYVTKPTQITIFVPCNQNASNMEMQLLQLQATESLVLRSWFPMPLNLIQLPLDIQTVKRHFLDKPLYNTIPLDKDVHKTILFHTGSYGDNFISKSDNWAFDGGNFYYPDSVFKCPKKCKVTMNRDLAEEAHAIVFSVLDVIHYTKEGQLRYPNLDKRKPEQIWVAHTYEAPMYHEEPIKHHLGEIGKLFNWTYTYQIDSDVYYPYGHVYKLDTPRSLDEIRLPSNEILRSKKFVMSLISHCAARSHRDEVIDAIATHISVDRFGNCGKSCPVGKPFPDKTCRRYLSSRYKFILAFENSLCQDYITEKFFDALDMGIVPVTYGLGDYAEVAPPHSYINALDFPNVTALTDYLKFLNENHDEYRKYFHWKQYYSVSVQNLATNVCALCVKLWEEPRMYTQQVTNFHDWWVRKRAIRRDNSDAVDNLSMTLGATLLRNTKQACIPLSNNIFSQGYLN